MTTTKLPIMIAITCSLAGAARADDRTARGGDDDNDDERAHASVPNCNEVPALPCYEEVWVDGRPAKMAFYDLDVKTNPPAQNFYVTAPQTGTPQGIAPFLHDHVVDNDDGRYWHGYLVVCSEAGLASGDCVTSAAPGAMPMAETVRGRRLTKVWHIEDAASEGLVTLIDTNAVMRARVERCGHHSHR